MVPLIYSMACFVPFVAAAQGEQGVRLLREGKSEHRIVLNPGARPSEWHAALELRTFFYQCTGAELVVSEGQPTPDGPMIVLGCGEVARKLGVSPTADQLGEQGFVMKTVPPHLVIAGSREAGTLYGVHRFLEQHLGVRWFAPGVTRTPAVTSLTIPGVDRLVRPAFPYRNTSYTWPGGDADFLSRMGDNGGGGGPDHPQGIQYSFAGTCHSYFHYISPSEFFKDHPEYFSEIGGARFGGETQLCLTNPDVLRIVTERVLERMKSQPQFRQYNFSQMDYYNYCQCSKCRAINEQFGTLGGTQYWFVNQLAERTSKVFPNKLIGTLAYMYTEEPPKNLKMHPNVAVWLCHMFPCCDSHPIATCPRNADYKRRAMAWSKICSHLYIWHYIVDFAHYYNPFPNFRAMAADMRFYRDIGAEGVYLQGMGHSGGGGEFSLLRPYYGTRLLWDPDQEAEGIIRDFLAGYYGAAAGPIEQYITLLHDKVEKDNIHMHLYTNPAQGYLPDEVVREAMTLFDRAEAAVRDDAELLERVRVARMPLTYARLFPRNGYKIEEGRLQWLGDMAPQTEAAQFVQRMKKHGFGTVREHSGDPEQMVMMGGLFNSRLSVVTLQNEHLSADIVPMLAGRILRIIDRKTGQCVTAHNVTRGLFFPFAGGLEDRIGEVYWSTGWIEPATAVTKTDRSVVLALQTVDGFQMKRSIAILPDRPILEITTTVTNPKKTAAGVRLRNHLELDLGVLPKTRVRFTDRAGRPVDKDMTRIIDGLREGEHYYDQSAPAGSWTLSGTKGLQLTQTFEPEGVDFAWLYAYPEDLGQLEAESWLKRTVLESGRSLTFRHQLEIRNAR